MSCPPGFRRRSNVEIVCARKGLVLVSSRSELVTAMREALGLST